MIRIKKLSAFCLAVALCCTNMDSSYASQVGYSLEDHSMVSAFSVEKDSLGLDAETYDIPVEVEDYIAGVFEKDENAEVTVYAPSSEISTLSSSGSWAPTRTYQGFTLQDWNVQVLNAFDMTSIRAGSTAYAFADAISAYSAGVLLDRVIPFGSAGVTLIQFITGSSSSVYASSGDKASAAPKYISVTRFTYVNRNGSFVLGARTQQVNLQSIMWYYYSDKNHTQQSGNRSYNRLISTPSYGNPDPKAITGSASGGYIENTISIHIGDKDFVLD